MQDIVGFTSMSKEVPPTVVMKFLNNLFGRFDRLLEEHNVQKVETAGDCYIVASGVLAVAADGSSEVLSSHDPQVSASRVLSFAQAMLRHSKMMKMPHNGEPVLIRIGIHTGDCVSGLVGSTLHKFGLFGDTMNTASRMESTSIPGRIQISASTYSMLPTDQQGQFEATSGVEVKGKGLMQTYLWVESSMIHIVESPSARYQKQSTLLAMTQAYNDAFSLFHSTSSFKRLSPFCGQAIEGQSQAPPDIPSRKSFDTRQVRKFASQPQAAQPVGLAFHSHRPDNDLDS